MINSAHQIFEWTGSGWAQGPGAARRHRRRRRRVVVARRDQRGAGWVRHLRMERQRLGPGTGRGGRHRRGPDGTPFVINSAHQIFEWTGSGWAQGPGAARDIAVGADGSVWIIGTNAVPGGYGIYESNGSGWSPVPGGAVDITVGPEGRPWVINSSHHIYAG